LTPTIADSQVKGTIQNVPLPRYGNLSDPSITPDNTSIPSPDLAEPPDQYLILLDNGTTVEQTYEIIIATTKPTHTADPSTSLHSERMAGIPSCFQNKAKVTYDHNGAYHKGFIHHSLLDGFHFVVKRNLRSTKVDWSIPLPNFKQNWTTLVAKDILLSDHTTISSFLAAAYKNTAPSANFVSGKNLLSPCPPSLSKARHPSNLDHKV